MIKKSFKLLIKFYVACFALFFLAIFIFNISDPNLKKTIWIILFGNFVIALLTQSISSYIVKKEKNEAAAPKDSTKAQDLLYDDKWNCIIRCSAGIAEMILYTITFALGLTDIIVGYLILKTLSIWDPKSVVKKGISTSSLRIAVVLSLIFAFWASYFFHDYLISKFKVNNSFPLTHHVNVFNF
jgi:hypothetical protein